MSEPRWYSELNENAYGMTIRVDREIAHETSPYQTCEIFDNAYLGRVMTLDGFVMLTERHEFTYHEMLVHPALFAHPDPKQVLVIGGGDGGTLREVTRHPGVQRAVLCEIDEMVIRLSKEHLPFTAVGFEHPRAEVFVGDGIGYIKEHPAAFDVIIVDSTDPIGFAEGLFREPFYRNVKTALKPGGIFVQQTESIFYQESTWRRPFTELRQVFGEVHAYASAVPMYPSGFWSFGFASDDRDPWRAFDLDRANRMEGLRYYHPDLQRGAFMLPKNMRL